MTLQDRLQLFLAHKKLSTSTFEKMCGFGNGTAKRFSENSKPRTIDCICSRFPELNREWLLTGEGEMIRTQQQAPTITQKVTGEDNYVSGTGDVSLREGVPVDTLNKAFEEIAAQRSLTARAQAQMDRAQAQIDRLIELLAEAQKGTQ